MKIKLLPEFFVSLKSLHIALTFLFVFAFSLSAVSQTPEEPKRYDVTVNNTPLRDAIIVVERETGNRFFMSDDMPSMETKVSVNAIGKTFDEIMHMLLDDLSLTWKRMDNGLIVITALQEKTAAPKTVRGVVRDGNNDPLPGTMVLLKGTSVGAPTDASGKYSINIPSGVSNPILVFQFLGMETKEVRVGNRTVLDVTLEESANVISEVVVTGMAPVDKRMFTGATDRLVAEDVMLAGVPEISRALEGRSAGVTVQNVSGTFGAAPKIRIRGATSIYGNSKPLWVVDGVIMEDVMEINADDMASGNVETLIGSAISGLNSEDIETFQILKDGSATSIYGARAMAGVIVITTKKGKAGQSRINYSGEFTIRARPRYSDFNIMNSQEQMSVYKDMQDKGWLNYAETVRASSYGVYGRMYQLMNTYDPDTGLFQMYNSPQYYNAYLREAEMRNTDWFKLLFRPSVLQTHSLSISTGTEKSSAYGSLSLMQDPGWTDKSSVRRLTANMNYSHKIIPSLTATIIGNVSYRKQEAPGTQDQQVDNVYGEVKRGFDINPFSYALNTSRTADPSIYYRRNYAPFNIKNELDNNYINLNVVDLKVQGELKWKAARNLEFAVLGALKYSTSSNEHHVKDRSNQALAYRAMEDDLIRRNNPYLYDDPDYPYDPKETILPRGGIYRVQNFRMLGYDFRASVTWNKAIGDNHYVSAFAGLETNAVDRMNNRFTGWGMQYAMGEVPFYPYEYFKQGVEMNDAYYSLSNTRSRNAAFFGTATYSFKGRYTVNGTIRYEGSNQLGRSRQARWLPTWNISGRWNISEEKFFQPVTKVVNDFSARISYSLTADRGPSWVSNSQVVVNSTNKYRPTADNKELALQISGIENSELTYEKKHEFNVGFDMSLVNSRINVSFDWYRRNQYDLIGTINTEGVGGWINKYANIAAMSSQGAELSVTTQNINGRNFKWSTSFIFANSKTEITDLLDKPSIMKMISGTGYAMEGYPVRSLFSLKFMELDNDGIPVIIDEGGNPTSGRINYQSNNIQHLKYEGPTDPKIAGSFGNMFRYKGFSLNVFFTYSFGNFIRLDQVFRSNYSDLTAMPREFKDRWMVPGDEKHTNVPAIVTRRQNANNSGLYYIYNAYNFTDVRVAKGDFIRLKELSLSYDFPKEWISKLRINSLALKVQATNLFLLHADKKLNGQDPEFFRSGGVASPIPRQFTLTLRIGM